VIDLTLVTPTIPERSDLLAQLGDAVAAQTVPPACWSVLTDHAHEGPVALRNRMVDVAETTWVHPIDDDDLIDPDHLETLAQHLTDDVDIVYSWCRVESADLAPEAFCAPLDHALTSLRHQNFIPNAAAIRRDVWLDLGGQREGAWAEDWDMWLRARHAGARFHCIERTTWTYRLSGDWEHYSTTPEGDAWR
jgi:hypothetical protein